MTAKSLATKLREVIEELDDLECDAVDLDADPVVDKLVEARGKLAAAVRAAEQIGAEQ
jgi:hypothetical protein